MLIGVSGLAGSGKDTAADILVSRFHFVKVAFADPLKRIVREVYDFTDDQLWGPSSSRNAPDTRYLSSTSERHDWEESPGTWLCVRCGQISGSETPQCLRYLTPRHALQQLGTEWGRNCYENTWVDYALRVAADLDSDPKLEYSAKEGLLTSDKNNEKFAGVVIPDVRFSNEIKALKAKGGRIIRVVRPSTLKGLAALHPSEQEQLKIPDSEFHAVIQNDKSIEDLAVALTKVLESFK